MNNFLYQYDIRNEMSHSRVKSGLKMVQTVTKTQKILISNGFEHFKSTEILDY